LAAVPVGLVMVSVPALATPARETGRMFKRLLREPYWCAAGRRM